MSFDQARQTLSWGEEALDEFHEICRLFFESRPYKKITDFDPETREYVDKHVFTAQFPVHAAARKVTEAVRNIKSSFDQATHAASIATNPSLFKNAGNFPWTDTEAGFKQRIAKSKIPEVLRDEFWRLRPYGTGDGCTDADAISSKLATLANRNHDIGVSIIPDVGSYRQDILSVRTAFQSLNPIWDPVKNEIELMRYPVGKPNYTYSINAYVAFDQTTPLEGLPVRSSVRTFAAKAHKVLERLSAISG